MTLNHGPIGSFQGGHWLIWSCGKVAKVAGHHPERWLEGNNVARKYIKRCHNQGDIWYKLLLPTLPEPNKTASKCIKHCHCQAGQGPGWPAAHQKLALPAWSHFRWLQAGRASSENERAWTNFKRSGVQESANISGPSKICWQIQKA